MPSGKMAPPSDESSSKNSAERKQSNFTFSSTKECVGGRTGHVTPKGSARKRKS